MSCCDDEMMRSKSDSIKLVMMYTSWGDDTAKSLVFNKRTSILSLKIAEIHRVQRAKLQGHAQISA